MKLKMYIINSAWINDQYENEYQGVHTHSGVEDIGFSSILYLKVPDFGKEITDTGKKLNGKNTINRKLWWHLE